MIAAYDDRPEYDDIDTHRMVYAEARKAAGRCHYCRSFYGDAAEWARADYCAPREHPHAGCTPDAEALSYAADQLRAKGLLS